VFNTIVVGVDGRSGGRDALALADRLSRLFGGELVAVHAYPYDFFVSRGASPDFESVMHGNADDLVTGELERTGVAAHAVAVPDGSPGRALHIAANRHDSDLIVVGSAHRGLLGRVLAGDVTVGALHGARCPVVVAPAGYAERATDIRTIGVGYDGSPEARAAVDLARGLATTAGARLRVIRVLEPPMPGGPGVWYYEDWHERADGREAAATRSPAAWRTRPARRCTCSPSWHEDADVAGRGARSRMARLRGGRPPTRQLESARARGRLPAARPAAWRRGSCRGRCCGRPVINHAQSLQSASTPDMALMPTSIACQALPAWNGSPAAKRIGTENPSIFLPSRQAGDVPTL
jgi:nucleotide-binding universal stress UspA family protein